MMKRSFLLLFSIMAFISGSCFKAQDKMFFYAKDLKDRNIVEFRWLKEMEDYVFNKKKDKDRTENERSFYLVCFFDAEMERGGFAKFFENVTARLKSEMEVGKEIQDTIMALKALKMKDRAGILEEAYAVNKSLNKPESTAEQSGADADKILEEYSTRYYRLSAADTYYLEGLILKLTSFVENNINDFYIVR